MNVAIGVLLIVCFFSVFAYADDSAREFSFKTVDGKTLEDHAELSSDIEAILKR